MKPLSPCPICGSRHITATINCGVERDDIVDCDYAARVPVAWNLNIRCNCCGYWVSCKIQNHDQLHTTLERVWNNAWRIK
jgi:hypothetical protein